MSTLPYTGKDILVLSYSFSEGGITIGDGFLLEEPDADAVALLLPAVRSAREAEKDASGSFFDVSFDIAVFGEEDYDLAGAVAAWDRFVMLALRNAADEGLDAVWIDLGFPGEAGAPDEAADAPLLALVADGDFLFALAESAETDREAALLHEEAETAPAAWSEVDSLLWLAASAPALPDGSLAAEGVALEGGGAIDAEALL